MKAPGRVVPFERPADYWAVRARRHRAPDRQLDAARLLRKALEKGGGSETALELSNIYANMDCYGASERYLLRAAAAGGLTGEVCFGVACCALNRGDEALGEEALDVSLRLSPDGPCAERAQDILETYPWKYETPLPGRARSDTLCRRARAAWAGGDTEGALRLARSAWKKGESREAAWLLGALLPPEKGLPYLRRGKRFSGGAPEGHFYLAEAYAQLGRYAEARAELLSVGKKCDTLRRCESFCLAAWRAGCPDIALELVNEKLRRMPLSADYLRLQYLCLKRTDQEDAAARALETLLEIDPEDPAGQWYRRHPEECAFDLGGGAVLAVLGGMVYAFPERLRRGPLNRLLHELAMTLRDRVEIQVIYRAVPPLWRRLNRAEQWALDDRRHPSLTAAFAACALLCAGKEQDAAALLKAAPGRKRSLRLLRRLIRWSEEEKNRAVHQL